MRNRVKKKIYYRIVFQLASALSVGSGENHYSDGDLVRDSAGEPFIPGSSLAGIYRSFLKEEDAERYFETAKDKEERVGSQVTVYDAKLHYIIEDQEKEGSFYRSVLRDSVALDEWKTGKERSKFDFEVIEPGAEFVTYLEQNCRNDDKDIGAELAWVWKKQQIRIGRKTMRGLGSIKKVRVYRRSFELDRKAELDAWLDFDMYREEDWKNQEFEEKDKQEIRRKDKISIEFTLKQKGGISIRRYTTKVSNGQAQPDAEQLTCIMERDGKEIPYIPGSSWSGAFRHHMESLIPGCTKDYFGSIERRSSVRFEESIIERASQKILTRNAVDRFTGSVIETALFTEKMWYGGETVLRIEIPVVLDGLSIEFRQALAASLVDLHMGILSVGGQTAVGRGIFEGKTLSINHKPIPVSDKMFEQILHRLGE